MVISKVLDQKLMISAFFYRLIMGIGVGLLYTHYYGSGDTLNYHLDALNLLSLLKEKPYQFFFGDDLLIISNSAFAYNHGAFFFVKITTCIYLLTDANYWYSTIVFSTISFFGSWFLVKTIAKLFPEHKNAALFSFLFLPSYVFWTSGLLKESIANFSICLLVSQTLLLAHSRKVHWYYIISVIFCGWLLLNLKYYFFGALIPILFAYSIFARLRARINNKETLKNLAIVLLSLVAGSLIVITTHDYLNPFLWKEIIMASPYNVLANYSDDIGMIQWLILVAKAITNVGFGPPLWETQNIFQVASSLESTFLFILLFMNLGRNPVFWEWRMEIWMILLYSLVISIFLGLIISNYGSLVRYRTSFYPFLFLLSTIYLKRNLSFIKGIFEIKLKRIWKSR